MSTKLFAFDLDGTLLRSDKTISERAISVINQVVSKGHLVCIATARPPRDIPRLVPGTLVHQYRICYNGAEAYTKGNRIFAHHIEPDLAYQLINKLSQLQPNLFIGVECQDTFHVNRSPAHLFGDTPHRQIALTDRQHAIFNDGITKIIHEGFGATSDAVTLDALDEVCAVTHTDKGAIVQIMAHGVSKWAALEHIAQLENVALQDIVAFGDDHNDLAMLTSCGMGVAMANATPAILAASAYKTASNDEDGVAVFLEGNFL